MILLCDIFINIILISLSLSFVIFIYFKLLFVATVLGEILENLKEQETEKQQMKSIDMETEFMQDDSSALPSKTSHN